MKRIAELIGARFGIDAAGIQEPVMDGDDRVIAELLDHRSCRRYTDAPVSDTLLETLLACAQSAPTKSNLQQYSIILVDDPAQRERLAPLCPNTVQLTSCPVFLVFCADLRRNQNIAEFRGREFANNSMDGFVNGVIDAAMAMQCFITAAESAGLGCAAISEIRNKIDAVSDVLGLPDGVFPICGLTVGWPAHPGFINQRLAPDIVIHRDRYDEQGLEDKIAAYDALRHEIFAIPPNRQIHTDKYGVSDTYTWSENTARQLSVPERPGLREFLLAHGFDLK